MMYEMPDISSIWLSLYKKIMKKINYSKGDFINGLKVIGNTDSFIEPNGRKRRALIFECKYCGNEFKSRIGDVQNRKTGSCGCHKLNSCINRLTTHGKANSLVYHTWQNIKLRCFNKNVESYKNYGGRGISMYNEWISRFDLFYNYVSTLENFNESRIGRGKNQLSLDRINNDKNYEPDNLRWATRIEQANNSRRWQVT